MNAQRFRIAVASAVILLLIGIGAFLVYDMNAPVQEVRFYEVPEPGSRAVLVAPVARGASVTISSNSENPDPQMLNDNASPLLSEECCPDDLSEMVVLDNNHDSNPVSPEVIEDARRLREWQEASALHQEKIAAHEEEGNELMQNGLLMSIIQDLDAAQYSEKRVYDKEYALRRDNQISADLEALIPKIENWGKRGTALSQDAPKYPTLTHTH